LGDVKNTTWGEALQAACPHIQRAIARQEHRRSTHFRKVTTNKNGKPTVEVQYHSDFVDDTVPAKHVFSEEEQDAARRIHLGEKRGKDLGIEVFVQGRHEQEQRRDQSSIRSLSQRVLVNSHSCDGEMVCSTAEVRIHWARKRIPIDCSISDLGKG